MSTLTPGQLVDEIEADGYDREEYLRGLRELVSSSGHPFIKVTFYPPEDGSEQPQAEVTAAGIADEAVATVLREVADLVESQLA